MAVAKILGVLIAILLLAFAGMFAIRIIRGSNTGGINELISHITAPTGPASEEAQMYSSRNTLPDCSTGTLLTRSPADIGTFAEIIPLGNISTSNGNASHVVPTDHIYFQNTPSNTPTSNEVQAIKVNETIPVFAPGNVQIVEIDAKTYTDNASGDIAKDYSIYFSPCKQVVLYLHHITDINPIISNALDSAAPNMKQCFNGNIDTFAIQTCNYFNMDLKLNAGDRIGLGAFDLGAYDYRQQPAAFIDADKATTLWGACPLDYFADPVKTQLYKMVKNTKTNALGLPDCGSYMQDVAGTIQGNWYLPGTVNQNQGGAQNDHELAIIHLNTNPNVGVISWGGGIGRPEQLHFDPTAAGNVNREPSEVTDSQLYCYQSNSDSQTNDHVTIQLTDSKTLKAEYGNGNCPVSPSFNNPTIYYR